MEELRSDIALNVLFKGIEMVVDRQKNNAPSQQLSQVANFFKQWVFGVSVNPQEAPGGEATMDVCELENRILYSGSPLPVEMVVGEVNPEVADVSDAGLHAETLAESPFEIQMDVFELDGLNELGFVNDIETLELFSNSSRVEEIIFIDSGIESYEVMLHDLQSQLGDSDTAEIVVLDDVDGIQKITETLHQHQDLKAIHLVAHGTTGAIELGNTALSNDNIAGYAGEIASWRNALSESADILFYGCDLGNGPEGLEFLETMTELTDAEVAGSDDLTGHASWMGDWELEISTGVIESELVFSESFQKSWTYALALSDAITAEETTTEALSNETVMSSSASSEDVVNQDEVIEFLSELRLQEGATVTLGASNFTLNGNVPDANSQYMVNNVLGGHFAFATEPDLAVANFTQQEVNEGSVIFVDDADDLAPSYDISILNPDDSSIITTSASIFLLPVNDPAVISLSMTEFSLNQNSGPIAINGITISDPDGGTGMIEVLVSVESGIIDLDPVFGASVHSNGESSFTISGEIDAVGKSLRNLTYQPNADFTGVDVLQLLLTDTGADASNSDTPQIATATLEVQATGTNGGDGGDFSIFAPGEITIDGEGTERRALIDLHHLFDCIGNPVEHPDPDWEVVEVTDISLFRSIAVTNEDVLRMVARASAEGSALVKVQVSYPDGTVGEAILSVNVESSSGEVLEDPRQFNWMERLLPKGADYDSDVLFVNSSACSEMSLVIADTTTADDSEDQSDSPDGSRVEGHGGDGNQAVVEHAPAPISELIRSASDARWMGPRDLGTGGGLSEVILAVHDFDFSSDLDYQDRSADADISQFRFQTQIKNSNLSSLAETPFSEVLEVSSPLAFAALDEYSEQLNQTANHFGVAVAGSLISLSGLSIGVVTWVARNSAIVTSLMANMPTWQLIDPLMVLGGDDELEAGESVIDIISAGEPSDEASQVGRLG